LKQLFPSIHSWKSCADKKKSKDTVEPLVKARIQDKFQSPFVGLGPSQRTLLETTLSHIAQEFTKTSLSATDAYLAPYLAIVQASGVGKSRTVIEVAKQRFSFYICNRPAGSSYSIIEVMIME
jgi:hypothetical protein